MEVFDIYKDIQARTNGEIYFGIVGPVRTGKSTFIKRFMDVMVIPNIKDLPSKERAKDELPQSASGKTIMTAEPKFVPKDGAEICLMDDIKVKVRLVDCVGYMVEGAAGHMENGEERKVKTPWFPYEIPFTMAATVGTQKVIKDHATIGIVVTTDGSIGELNRSAYIDGEEKTIRELQNIGKPFIVLVNSLKPYGHEAKQVVNEIKEKYNETVIAVNCEQLKEEDIHEIMKLLLFSFPVSELYYYLPKWVELLPQDDAIQVALQQYMKDLLYHFKEVKDVKKALPDPENEYVEDVKVESVQMDTGCISVRILLKERYYYDMLSELTGSEIRNEYSFMCMLRNMATIKKEYEEIKDAIFSVKLKGYGVVQPTKEEITVDVPEIIKQGNKYGVKIHSSAPSIHMIRANIETEIAPIIGNEEQAKDLVNYMNEQAKTNEGIWAASVFGKSIEEMVTEGMRQKIAMINDESQLKLQDTMQKIVNDSNGGMVCIII